MPCSTGNKCQCQSAHFAYEKAVEFKRFLFHSRLVGVMTIFPAGYLCGQIVQGWFQRVFPFTSLGTFGSEMNVITLANDRKMDKSLIPFLVQVVQRDNINIFL